MAKRSTVHESGSASTGAVTLHDTRAPRPRVSSLMIRSLVEVARGRGVAPDALFGCSADEYFARPDDGWASLDEFQALLARAIRLSEEPALGLYLALEASESSYGVMAPLVSHAQTLRHAIRLTSQFHALLLEDSRVQLQERLGTARLCCDLHYPVDRTVVEMIVAGQVRTLRSFGCTAADIRVVAFKYARPDHHEAYATAFRGAERFEQPFTGIEFQAQVLDRPHMHRQPELLTLLRDQAERTLERLVRPLNVVERVRAFLASQRESQPADMEEISRELGMSVRSLRRRLEEEGTSYRALQQSLVHETACAMLRDPDLTLQTIAHELGFSDSAAFHRAFKRWSGLTPVEYREAAAHRGEATAQDT